MLRRSHLGSERTSFRVPTTTTMTITMTMEDTHDT